jgi:hypothetical protein
MSDRTDTYYAVEESSIGYGAELLVGDGASPEVFEAIAGIVSITPGEMSTEDVQRTHLRSPDAHHEHMPGLRDSGAISVTGRWLPTEESQSNSGGGTGAFADGGLIKLWRSREVRNFQIRVPAFGSAGVLPFRGYVSKFQPSEFNTSDPIDFTAEFMPTQAYDANWP